MPQHIGTRDLPGTVSLRVYVNLGGGRRRLSIPLLPTPAGTPGAGSGYNELCVNQCKGRERTHKPEALEITKLKFQYLNRFTLQ